MKNVILSEAKDLKWPKNEILRYTQNDKKQERCFFTQSNGPLLSPVLFTSTNKVICSPLA
ncbi:MAG: hypothetical protein ACOCG5_07110 [Candidatus Alkaliphilus sp. MAG34]